MSVPLFGGSSLKKITAATLSVNGRGQGEEASARRWCGMAWRGVVPPRCCGRSAHGRLLPIRRKPRYKSRRLPCQPASSKAVNSTWVLSPIWQIVLLDASLPWSCYSLLVLPHAKRVFKSKQLMHLEEDRTGQQAWPSASFHVLVHESILFFSPLSFLKFSSTGTEGKPEFSCGPGLAKPPSCAGSAGHGVLYSPPPQPVPRPSTATLSLWARRCERTWGNPHTNRESASTGARHLCRTTEGRTPVQSCSPSEAADHSTRLLRYSIHTGRHAGGSPLLLTYRKASPWTSNCETEKENSIKDERGKLCTVKSNDINSSFPSFI